MRDLPKLRGCIRRIVPKVDRFWRSGHRSSLITVDYVKTEGSKRVKLWIMVGAGDVRKDGWEFNRR